MKRAILIAIAIIGTAYANDEDDYANEEIVAAIERQTEAIESAIEEQTFQQQLDTVLIEDAIENSQQRQRWYFWRNCFE